MANGRRRKKIITTLEHEGVEVSDGEGIQQIICNYYKQWFGKQLERKVTMKEDAWSLGGNLSREDNEDLTRPFTENEVKEVVFSMKENSAPGPDGFGVAFYKKNAGGDKGGTHGHAK